ncbi:hypothetical protein [Microbacterium sediminicola]
MFVAPNGRATLGGLICSYWPTDGNWLYAEVFPVSSLTADVLQLRDECGWGGDYGLCRASTISAGVWISLTAEPSVRTDDPTTAPIPDWLTEALDDAASRVSTWAEPHAATRTAAWWNIADACTQIASQLDIPAILMSSDYIEGYPTDAFSTGAIADLVEEQGTEEWCAWYSYESGRGIYLELFPGAGSTWSSYTSDAILLEVEGASSAAQVPNFMGGEATLATDGTNVVAVSHTDADHAMIAAAVFTALGR